MSRLSLRSFIESAKLDWSELYFSPDTGTAFSYEFPIMPDEFIAFAKADLQLGNARGLVNALSNAKRAIDCQADVFILATGLNPQELGRQLGQTGITLLADGRRTDGPLKFRLLQTLGVATPAIVARMRKLRNALEHDYRKPRRNEVNDAIDVAELFVQACAGKMRSVLDSFAFGSGISMARGEKMVARDFYVRFNLRPQPQFKVTFWDQERIAKEGNSQKSPTMNVRLGDDSYLPLLKLLWHTDWDKDMSESLAKFLTELGISFPRSRFRALPWCL
jgi:hypothetical protein